MELWKTIGAAAAVLGIAANIWALDAVWRFARLELGLDLGGEDDPLGRAHGDVPVLPVQPNIKGE